MTASPVIDLSRLPAPNAIEPLSVEALNTAYVNRFKSTWSALRQKYPELPMYDVEMLETDPAMIVGQAFSYLRLLDRARVNDGVRAVLAPFARGADLDNVAARVNIERLELVSATLTTPAIMESDAQLLRRYLLAFDRPSAGSADRYLYEAYTAWPGIHDASVLGRVVHGRLGMVDIVVAGPNGDVPTGPDLATVRAAVTATDVKPEATGVTVLAAVRSTYTVSLIIDIPRGPDPSLVVDDARRRVLAVAVERMKIGVGVRADAISAAAYGPNVMRVRRILPAADIEPNPYRIPVCTGVMIEAEVLL